MSVKPKKGYVGRNAALKSHYYNGSLDLNTLVLAAKHKHISKSS